VPGISEIVMEEQYSNAVVPMTCIFCGIELRTRLVQCEKQECGISVTPLGIYTEIRFEQELNAYDPKLETLSGIEIDLRLTQLKKQYAGIEVIQLGIIISLSAAQPTKE
jgi:hypothetical protein